MKKTSARHPKMNVVAAGKILPFCGLSLAFFVSGCATAKVEMADAHFTKPALTGEKMAIGPVVQVSGDPVKDHEAEAIRNQLQKAISSKRDYIQVNSSVGPNLIHRLGGTAEDGISHSMRSAAKDQGVRFLMLTELTGNCVSFDIDQNCEDQTEDICDENGKVVGRRLIGRHYETTSRSIRNVAARFKVLDLENGKTVWVSRSDYSNSTSNSAESCCCFPPAPPYPAPPEADGVGMTIARAAVRKLPRGGL